MDTKHLGLSLSVLLCMAASWPGVGGQNDKSSQTPPTVTTTTTSGTTTSNTPYPLKVLTILDPPFVSMSARGDKMKGLAVDVLEEALKNDPSYKIGDIKLHNNDKFGYEENTGVWDGLIRAVQNETADVALAAFSITAKRSTVVDFTHPFMHAGYRALYKIPDSWHPGEAMVTILRPFTPGLWVLLVFMFALTAVSLYMIGRFSPYEDTAFVGKTATYDGLTLPNSLLYTFSSLVWQGYTAAPKSISGRVLTCVWWVFCVFTVGAYIAGLCVILFRVNPEIRTLPFTTMDEMSRQSKVGVMVVANGSAHQYLQQSKGKIEMRLLAMINLHPKDCLVGSLSDGIDKMVQSDGKFVLLMDGPAAEYISSQEPCDKMVIGEPLSDHQYGFVCRKGSSICQSITTGILSLQEAGRLHELRQKWLHGGCFEGKPDNYIFEGLPFFDTFAGEPDAIMPLIITIKRFSAAFIILVLGIVAAGIILLVEIFYAKRRGVAVPRKLERGRPDDDMERIENEFHDERA